MKKNKCTLIVDGNWLLMSSFNRIRNEFDKENDLEQRKNAKNQLINNISYTIISTLNQFPGVIDNVMFVRDKSSWRKSIEKPLMCMDDNYKGTRVYDIALDWDMIFGSLDEIQENLKDLNISWMCEEGVEGDDWMWFWSRYLNRNNINCIVWSSDCDLKQLVQQDKNTRCWTAWWNKRSGLTVHECYNINNIDVMSILLGETIENVSMNNLQKCVAGSYNIEYINPNDIINEKIMMGDISDNIKSLIRVKKNKKTSNVSKKDWQDLKEHFELDKEGQLEQQIDTIIDYLLSKKKFQECTYTKEEIKDMFNYNKTLVMLNENIIPQHIKDAMNKHIDEYDICDISQLKEHLTEKNSNDNYIDLLVQNLI